jgi:hypothetical protein
VFAEPCDHDATVLADVPVADVAASAADLLGLRVREPAAAG